MAGLPATGLPVAVPVAIFTMRVFIFISFILLLLYIDLKKPFFSISNYLYYKDMIKFEIKKNYFDIFSFCITFLFISQK
jgi:hypothetical protein